MNHRSVVVNSSQTYKKFNKLRCFESVNWVSHLCNDVMRCRDRICTKRIPNHNVTLYSYHGSLNRVIVSNTDTSESRWIFYPLVDVSIIPIWWKIDIRVGDLLPATRWLVNCWNGVCKLACFTHVQIDRWNGSYVLNIAFKKLPICG